MTPAIPHCTPELYHLRREGHRLFDALWMSGMMTRYDAYMLLARHLGLTRETCHWRYFTAEQCRAAIEFCKIASNLPRSPTRKKYHFTGNERRNRRRQIQRMREAEIVGEMEDDAA